MLSHPHPQSEFLMPKPQPLSHPPHKKSKMIIQMKELHPHPLLEEAVPHPHPVAVKSLIIASKRFLFMLYHPLLKKLKRLQKKYHIIDK